jgi:hypothetical protein
VPASANGLFRLARRHFPAVEWALEQQYAQVVSGAAQQDGGIPILLRPCAAHKPKAIRYNRPFIVSPATKDYP